MHPLVQEFLTDLGLEITHIHPNLELLASTDFRYLRDLKLNLKTTLNAEHLTEKEAVLIALAVVANEQHHELTKAFSIKAEALGATLEEIAEAISCASLLSANNILYRFRHFVGKDTYNAPARLRMNIMARPVLGKALFELISLAISAVNGCEVCVKSHEASVLETETSELKIYDAIRLTAVVVSLCKVV